MGDFSVTQAFVNQQVDNRVTPEAKIYLYNLMKLYEQDLVSRGLAFSTQRGANLDSASLLIRAEGKAHLDSGDYRILASKLDGYSGQPLKERVGIGYEFLLSQYLSQLSRIPESRVTESKEVPYTNDLAGKSDSYLINLIIARDPRFAFLKKFIPAGPLSQRTRLSDKLIDLMLQTPAVFITKGDPGNIEKDVTTTLAGRKYNRRFLEVLTQIVDHFIIKFYDMDPAVVATWLDELPVRDESPDLWTRFYREVLGLILGGVLYYAQDPKQPLTYEHLVYAVLQNPYYDLKPYL